MGSGHEWQASQEQQDGSANSDTTEAGRNTAYKQGYSRMKTAEFHKRIPTEGNRAYLQLGHATQAAEKYPGAQASQSGGFMWLIAHVPAAQKAVCQQNKHGRSLWTQ
jgi:hypothetical protein